MKSVLSWCAGALGLCLSAAPVVAATQPAGVTLPAYREVRLANEALLVLMERRDVPLVAFNASLRGGVTAEPAGLNGVAAVTAELLEKGAGGRDARQFAETVAAVGGVMTVAADIEKTEVSGEFMSRDIDLMIELLSDMLRAPRLDKAEFEKVRTRAIQSVTAAKDSDPRQLISTYASAFVYRDHPYGRAVTGSESTLERLTHDDVLAYYADNFGGDRLQLTMVGDFDADAIANRLEKRFGDWEPAKAPAPTIPKPSAARGERVYLIDKPDATQSYFWIGNIGVSRSDPDKAAIDLVNTLFGGRFTSMLNTALRVESGLTYGARSTITRHAEPGTVAIVYYTANESTTEAIDMALALLDRLERDGFDATTLASGKTYRQGLFPLGFETNSQLAAQVGQLKFYREPDAEVNDYATRIGAVSEKDARDVIGRVYPRRKDLVFVVIGSGDAIREDIERYGKVTEIPISAPRFIE